MITETNVPGFPVRRGKVRDIYDVGPNHLAIVTTDRISAFDWVLPTGIPNKGKILTELSLFWAELLNVYYHIAWGAPLPEAFAELKDRTMLVEKAEVIPFECVVRGYLAGSGWKEYKEKGEICGIKLPPGLRENQQLRKPIFTPATKEESGHDINVSFEYMAEKIGKELASELENRSLALYEDAVDYAWQRGIIIADTKFEWGRVKQTSDDIALIDEILTPDSSRFWPLDGYQMGGPVPSFDKQFVRDWLDQSGWDKNSPPPPLPEEIVTKTAEKYLEVYQRLTSK